MIVLRHRYLNIFIPFISCLTLISVYLAFYVVYFNHQQYTEGHHSSARKSQAQEGVRTVDRIAAVTATEGGLRTSVTAVSVDLLSRKRTRQLTILVWNSQSTNWIQTVQLPAVETHLNTECVFTLDRRRLNTSHAVIFYGDLMHLDHFPSTTHRPQFQKWIYFSLETPVNTVNTGIKQIRLQRQRRVYNLTATYSLSSHIPIPYYNSVCRIQQLNNVSKQRGELLRVVANKSRLVAWFVSHCQTTSRREVYVTQLQKYIPVDVYGRCGTFNCSRNRQNDPDNYYSACDDVITRQYKFYLALENSLCAHYVTEKFFRFLHRDVIVIALGAADYRRFAPRDTYIDVRDFRSPRDLATFVKRLASRDDLYVDYLLRKRSLLCETVWDKPEVRMCRHLADNINTTELADLSDAVDPHKVCVSAGKFYRGVADMITH